MYSKHVTLCILKFFIFMEGGHPDLAKLWMGVTLPCVWWMICLHLHVHVCICIKQKRLEHKSWFHSLCSCISVCIIRTDCYQEGLVWTHTASWILNMTVQTEWDQLIMYIQVGICTHTHSHMQWTTYKWKDRLRYTLYLTGAH